MDKITLQRLHIMAALTYDIDSPELDSILQRANLDPETATFKECLAEIRAEHYRQWDQIVSHLTRNMR